MRAFWFSDGRFLRRVAALRAEKTGVDGAKRPVRSPECSYQTVSQSAQPHASIRANLGYRVRVNLDNVASLRVAEKVGAIREGILRNRLVNADRADDAVMFSLIPNDLGIRQGKRKK